MEIPPVADKGGRPTFPVDTRTFGTAVLTVFVVFGIFGLYFGVDVPDTGVLSGFDSDEPGVEAGMDVVSLPSVPTDGIP